MESARRASEIHKRRTGRSLRVTEQDVINEEMYEEEDDDLPMGYRRLTAHLQTGSADFNRRLAAYLTNHVAMRSALDQAIHPFAYPTAGQASQPQSNMFPSPLLTQGLSDPPQQRTPTSPHSAHPYRQSPYPSPGTPGFRPSHPQLHNRSASMSLANREPAGSQSYAASPVEPPQATNSRRMSMPATSLADGDATGRISGQRFKPSLSRQHSSTSQHTGSANGAEGEASSASTMGPPQAPLFDPGHTYGTSPLTMSLPQDSRQLLGPALNSNDPFTAMLMSGGPISDTPFFDYGAFTGGAKPAQNNATISGMESTLAPSALSMSSNLGADGSASQFQDSLSNNFNDLKGFDLPGSQNSSNAESTGAQDASASWNAFIDDKQWNENAAA